MQRVQGLCVAVCGVAVLGCDANRAGLHYRRDPGALVVAQPADIVGLDPVRVLDSESIEVGGILFEGLTRWQLDTTDVEPGLATAFQVSADGLRWTFELRPDVVFHDGTVLDADAVVFSLQRASDPKHPNYVGDDDASNWRGLMKEITRVTALSPTRVEIEVAHPYAPLLSELARFPVVSPTAVRWWGLEFRRHPVGTGPYAFESWDVGEQVVVRRFERYWGQRPSLERIVFRVVVDARQRLVDLQSGTVDLAASILPDEQSFVEMHPDLVLLHASANDISYLAFNTTHPPFDDRRVRRAVNHAINKEPIVKLTYQGRAITADGPLPPTQWGYHAPATRYAYDPEIARQLLDEATASGGFDRTRVHKLYASSTPRAYLAHPERVARYLQAALSRIGVTTELVLMPIAEFREKVRRGEHDLALSGWIGDTGDPDNFLYALLHSDNAVPGSAQNLAFYRNPSVDTLLVEAQAASDHASRERLYARAQDLIVADAPWVPIAHSELVVAARTELEGVMLTPLGHLLYARIHRRGAK